MNRFRNLFTLLAFSLLVLALPAVASAQWRDRDRDDDYYGRDRDRDRGDYYGNGSSNRNLRATVKNLKNRSRNFERVLDRALDDSRYDDRRREDNLNELAERFKSATDDLEDSFGNGRDYNRSQDEAREVLNLGRQLDRAVSRARLDYRVQDEWNRISQDLRTLADAYGYRYNRNDRNNRNNRSGGGIWKNFPLPF